MFSSSSSSLPSCIRSRHRILTANIHVSILQFIAALLLTLMILWHISTITLVENYQMPRWWVRTFLAKHANGWRVAVWVVVGVFLPLDCMHALLCLDRWCAILHGRHIPEQDSVKEDGDGQMESCNDQEKEMRISEHEDAGNHRQGHHSHHTLTSLTFQVASDLPITVSAEAYPAPRALLYTRHPLLHRRLTLRTQSVLLSILDILMIAILAGHIVTYFVSLPTAIAFCSLPAVLTTPDQEFGEERVPLSVRDRCIGLNVDLQVAGGFAVFMALVLGMLHLATLAMRLWEWARFGQEGVARKEFANEDHEAGVEGKGGLTSSTFLTVRKPAPFKSRACSKAALYNTTSQSAGLLRNTTSIGAEERSTGIRCADWSCERAELTAR